MQSRKARPNVGDELTVSDRLREYLLSLDVEFREVHHEPTSTSEDSARARGEPLHVGGKALIIKVERVFHLFVLPADRQLDSAAVKRKLGAKKMRFATKDELLKQTGLVPGSVPPFGEPILPYPLFVDEAIKSNDRIAFNAGALTTSFILPMPEYLRSAKPTFMQLSVSYGV